MVVIKIGGSVLQSTPFNINPSFLRLLDIFRSHNDQVFIINGGGPLCRVLQNVLRGVGITDSDRLDLMGIKVNNMYAEFVRMLLPEDNTYPNIIVTKDDIDAAKRDLNKFKYFVGGAESPGHSSDYDAAIFAHAFGSDKVLRITNVDYLYDKDPNTYSDAQVIKNISWDSYLQMFDSVFVPGGSYPFDPVASRFAKDHKIRVFLTSIENIIRKNKISFEEFDGTVIG